MKYGRIGARFIIVAVDVIWLRGRSGYVYVAPFVVSVLVNWASVMTLTSAGATMLFGRQSGAGGPILSDPSPCKNRNLSSTGEEATPIGLDPIPGQNTTLTSFDFGVLTRAVYTFVPSFSFSSGGFSDQRKVYNSNTVSRCAAKVVELNVGRIDPDTFGRVSVVCRMGV